MAELLAGGGYDDLFNEGGDRPELSTLPIDDLLSILDICFNAASI